MALRPHVRAAFAVHTQINSKLRGLTMKKTLLAGSAAWMLAFTVQAKAGILDFSPLHCETGFVIQT